MMSRKTGAPRGRPFTLVLLVLTILHAASADTATDRVSSFVNEYLKKNQIPGCAIVVRHDGKIVLCQGYGVANMEHARARHAADDVSIRLDRKAIHRNGHHDAD